MFKNKQRKHRDLDAQTQSELIMLARKALAQGLSYYEVQEKIAHFFVKQQATAVVEAKVVQERPERIRSRMPAFVRWGALFVPLLLLSVGTYLLGSAVVPILGYYVRQDFTLFETELIAPIPRSQVLDITPFVYVASDNPAIPIAEAYEEPEVVLEALDYTNLANWFGGSAPELVESVSAQESMVEYSLSIPSLKIENAIVEIGGTDLEKNLIAYPGTALPGQHGAPVIFGHSVLRQFYNPSEKNPRRYNSIFSTIMTLKEGVDKIYVTADGVTYTYLVQQKTEVKPEDVYILTQQYDAKRLKLVTCVPEGTYLRRGVITAQLVEEQ